MMSWKILQMGIYYLSCINIFSKVNRHSRTCNNHIFIKTVENDKINSNILRCDITNHYSVTKKY